jgi:hypothetical protein
MDKNSRKVKHPDGIDKLFLLRSNFVEFIKKGSYGRTVWQVSEDGQICFMVQ